MATTHTFTVRAEDNTGAFADREFSITVRNTAVDRFMYVDTNNAYTSNDMTNWTTRTGQGGAIVQYGGGTWMVSVNGGTTACRYSTDGVQWNTTPAVPNYQRLSSWVFCRGHWYAVAKPNTNSYISSFIKANADFSSFSIITYSGNTTALGMTVTNIGVADKYVTAGSSSNGWVLDTDTGLIQPYAINPASPTATGGESSLPIRVGNMWYMMRTNNIGNTAWVARSADLVTWLHGNPISIPNADAAHPVVAPPLYYNGVFYFTTRQNSSANTGYYTSRDGINAEYTKVTNNGTVSENVNFTAAGGRVFMITPTRHRESSDLFTFANSSRFPTKPNMIAQAM